jgi:ADP-sugar diphosphatase
MGTFTLPNSACPINYPSDYNLTEEKITSFKPFKEWMAKLQHSMLLQESNKDHPFHSKPYKLRSIDVQAVDWFGPRIGFMKISAKITNDDDEFLPGAIFLRGASVAMMVRSTSLMLLLFQK